MIHTDTHCAAPSSNHWSFTLQDGSYPIASNDSQQMKVRKALGSKIYICILVINVTEAAQIVCMPISMYIYVHCCTLCCMHGVMSVERRIPLLVRQSLLTDFVDHLVVQVQNSALHDGYFLETLVLWLIQLCSSPLRQLRHTATFAGWYAVSMLNTQC